MNKQAYRIVFNQARGCLMAVAETASGRGKGASGERAGTLGHHGASRGTNCGEGHVLAGLALACKLACNAVLVGLPLFWCNAVQAQSVTTQIVADPSASATQRPTVLNSANGTVQVNIQTPSAAGVSRNSYSQFDVGSQGAILNNSRTDVSTQLGGWVQGNPWLATGAARVILNEVNSTSPSQLQGYVEVAGQRAQVVIANPAGIAVNGAGFINASGVTLTTGTPVMSGGSLESYRVQGGSVSIDGSGLDTRSADYTAILSRAVQVNAGIWAQQLQVVTGTNEVTASSIAADSTPVAQRLDASGSTPAYALDVAALGGMYAGKINLIGTEAGLGVRNDGQLLASSGSLTLSADGTLTNRGLIDAPDTRVQAQTVDNVGTGRLYGDRVAVAATTLNNREETTDGVTTAATIAGRERVDIGVQDLVNREQALIYSGGDMAIGGALDANWQASASAASVNNNSATIEAAQALSIQAASIRNTNEHFTTEVQQISQTDVTEYQHQPGDVYSASDNSTRFAPGEVSLSGCDVLCLTSPAGTSDSFVRYDVTRTISESVITETAPGKILAGQGISLVATTVLNDKSQIVAGGALDVTADSLTNNAGEGTRTTVDAGTVTSYWRVRHKGADSTGSATGAYAPGPAVNTIGLDAARFANNASDATTGNVPTSSLFTTHPDPGASYLVESDPRFTQYKNWLGSDYMLAQLQFDPATTQKRLGDGFYEQRLIREQVLALTGQRFLGDYRQDDAQYQALMDNGLTYARQWNLRPGVALSAEQAAQLTSDMVWLVAKDVTLADGSTQSVLVPQVYLRVRPGDVNGDGALLAGQDVKLNLSGDAINSGTIAGRNLVQLNADNIRNLGGTLSADQVALQASQDIDNIGGTIQAQSAAWLSAGRDLNLITTTQASTNQAGANSFTYQGVDRVAGLYVSGQAGVLLASAGRDINLVAAAIDNAQGSTSIHAGQSLKLTETKLNAGQNAILTAGQDIDLQDSQISAQGQVAMQAGGQITTTSSQESSSKVVNGVAVQRLSTTDNKSRIEGQQGVALVANGLIHLQATEVQATQGAVQLNSSTGILLDHNTDTEQRDWTVSYTRSSWGGLRKKTTTTHYQSQTSKAVGTQISGQSVEILGQNVISVGTQIDSQGLLHIEGADQTLLYATHNTQKFQADSQTRSSFFGFGTGKSRSQSSVFKTQAVATELISDSAVRIGVGERTELQGTSVQAPVIEFVRSTGAAADAAGQLLLGAALEQDQASEQSTSTTLGLWQSTEGKGHDRPSAQMTELTGQVNIAQGIITTIELPRLVEEGSTGPAPSLQQQVQQLAQGNSALAYLQDLQDNPQVRWNELELAQKQWQYEQQGLTGAGAALVALAVAWATSGMGVEMLGTTTSTATGTITTLGGVELASTTAAAVGAAASATTYAAGAALNAGFSALATSASVSFINNGGDIGKTLKDLGSKDSLKGLLTSMVTAGALNGLGNSVQINGKTLNSITVQDGFTANFGKAVVNNVAGATLSSALTGASAEDSLKSALTSALISAGAGQAANAIGDLTVPDPLTGQAVLNPLGQALAHALAGCVAGAAGTGSQGCQSGAIGAVVGELAAQWFDPDAQRSEAEVLEFARLMGGVAGALTGDGSAASVNTAALTAVNAVQNNYLQTRDLKHAIQQLDSCKAGCDSLRRLLTANGPGGIQTSVGQLQDLCRADPQACAVRVQDMAQALQELQTPEVRATLGAATADRLIQRQVNDLNQALDSLQWGVDHIESSTAIMKGAVMVGATAAGAGLLMNLGRAVVAACGSGVLTPACTGLMTELGIGVAEAASGVPTLGVSAPVATAAAARLTQAAKSADPALVAREVQAVLGEAKATESARLLNNFYRDGAPADLIQKAFNAAALNSTHNASSGEVVLGRFIAGSADSYDEVARARGSTYFSMSDWTAVQGQLGKEQMWNINKAFLDQQVAAGKSFVFTSDPAKAPIGSYTSREYDHLISVGYIFEQDSTGVFRAIKN